MAHNLKSLALCRFNECSHRCKCIFGSMLWSLYAHMCKYMYIVWHWYKLPCTWRASIFLNYKVYSFCSHSRIFFAFKTAYIYIYSSVKERKKRRICKKCKQNEQTYNDIQFSTELKEIRKILRFYSIRDLN